MHPVRAQCGTQSVLNTSTCLSYSVPRTPLPHESPSLLPLLSLEHRWVRIPSHHPFSSRKRDLWNRHESTLVLATRERPRGSIQLVLSQIQNSEQRAEVTTDLGSHQRALRFALTETLDFLAFYNYESVRNLLPFISLGILRVKSIQANLANCFFFFFL